MLTRHHWKAALTALTMTLAGLGGTASAQDFTFGWNPRSGDAWVDTWLGDMNRYGGRYRDPFVDEMVRLDLRYARARSLWTDINILLATPGAVIAGKGAV